MTEVFATEAGLLLELTRVRWWMRLYVHDLLSLLGPEPDLPDDPLAALAATAAGDPEMPADPVLARLLPDGVVDDDTAATEFRRFTHESLLTRKRADAKALLQVLSDPSRRLDQTQALQILGGVNDVRLMLGTRLMVTESVDDQIDDELDDLSDLAAYGSYLQLGWLQEQLLAVLTGEF